VRGAHVVVGAEHEGVTSVAGPERRVARCGCAGVGGATRVVGTALLGMRQSGRDLHRRLNPANVLGVVRILDRLGGKVEVSALVGISLITMMVIAGFVVRMPVSIGESL